MSGFIRDVIMAGAMLMIKINIASRCWEFKSQCL